MSRFAIICIVLLCLISCNNENTGEKEKNSKVERSIQVSKSILPIHIYRYETLSRTKAEYLRVELQKVYPSVVLQDSSIELPQKYYFKPRNRYSGNGLVRDLSVYKKNKVVLGLTNHAIYQANELSPTYGIFGVSPVGAHVAVISSIYPSGKKHTDEHLVKLMLHELGHAFGLNHCKDEHCYMVDAEHGNKFSKTPSFCKRCSEFLNKQGWTLK